MSKFVGQTILSQYRVEEFIASGGMGAVYRVWDIQRNVPLAMKVLQHDLVDDPTVLKYFHREARALKNLTHPNIVPFYGLFQTEDLTFILEEYIDGPTLRDILRKSPKGMDVSDAMKYIKALCSALGYAHSRGVVHCDIKPGNVMINSGGQVYLADFGIARHAQSTTTTIASAGTPAYMAPEQIRGEEVTPATDVYELGVLFYELLTGRRPFRGDETESINSGATAGERIRYSHLKLTPQNPSTLSYDIPAALSQVILKALSKKPQDRYPDMQSFFQAACDSTGLHVISSRVSLPPQDEKTNTNKHEGVVIPPPIPPKQREKEKGTSPEPQRPAAANPSNNLNSKYAMLAGGGLLFFMVMFFMFGMNNPNPGPSVSVTEVIPTVTEIETTQTPFTPNGSSITPTTAPPPSKTPVPIPTSTDTPIIVPNTEVPSPIPLVSSGYNLAFVSDKESGEGNMNVFIAAPNNISGSHKIATPFSYTHVLWPTFCGNRLALEVYPGNSQKIAFVNLETELWEEALTQYQESAVPRCSPDGNFLAYSKHAGTWNLVIEDLNRLGTTVSEYGSPSFNASWSRDNNKLLYMDNNPQAIYMTDIMFSKPEPINTGKYPSFSPDGRSIVYASGTSLKVYSFETGSDTTIFDGLISEDLVLNVKNHLAGASFWASDGWIYFDSVEGGDWDIFRIRPEGGQVENITQNWGSNELMPAFRP
jgi:serine/threonine protein kinase